MASWQYVFLFPSTNERLRPEEAAYILERLDLKIDPVVRRCVPIDPKGRLLDAGEEVPLAVPIMANIVKMLILGEQFSVHARDHDFTLVVFFAHRSSNPHLFFGWPRMLLDNLSNETQSRFWEVVRDFVKKTNASYVIVVDDAPDHFEDQFLEIDGLPYLDLTTNHKYGHGVSEVWVKGNSPLPEGPSFAKPIDLDDSFKRFRVMA